jgi:hypothetical protein
MIGVGEIGRITAVAIMTTAANRLRWFASRLPSRNSRSPVAGSVSPSSSRAGSKSLAARHRRSSAVARRSCRRSQASSAPAREAVLEVGSGVGLVLSNRRRREPSRAGLGRSRRHRGRGRPRRLEAVASVASARPVRARRSADARRYITAYDKEPEIIRLLFYSPACSPVFVPWTCFPARSRRKPVNLFSLLRCLAERLQTIPVVLPLGRCPARYLPAYPGTLLQFSLRLMGWSDPLSCLRGNPVAGVFFW